jgi:hypothetical protein
MQQDQFRIGSGRYVLCVVNQCALSVIESYHAQNSAIANLKGSVDFVVGNAYRSAT